MKPKKIENRHEGIRGLMKYTENGYYYIVQVSAIGDHYFSGRIIESTFPVEDFDRQVGEYCEEFYKKAFILI